MRKKRTWGRKFRPQVKQVIDNNTLVALTLLIAESNPKEKEILIDVIMSFLNTNKNSKII